MASTALIKRGTTALARLPRVSGWLDKLKGVNPNVLRAGGATAAGIYGYASSDGSVGQRIERGLGYAAGVGLATSKAFRGSLTHQSKVMGRAISRYGTGKGTAMMAGRAFGGAAGIGRGAAVGAMYGAIDDDTTILGGAAAGAGITLLGRGAARGIAAGNRVGMRTGAAAGGAVGLYAGGPVGMVAGAGIGGGIGGAARMYRGAGRAGKFGMRVAGATVAAGGIAGVMAGGAGANAYAMHNGRNSLGADGDLALGLHSMRHG